MKKFTRPKYQEDTVTKTVSLPEILLIDSLKIAAHRGHGNFSQVVRDALESYIALEKEV